eukprot:gene6694-7401_t
MMLWILTFLVLLSLSSAKLRVETKNSTIPCNTFDPKKIKLVTFDVFAALMDLDTSLKSSVAKILPSLSQQQVKSLAEQWENAYGDYAGTVFDESVTGPSPFQWVISTSLTSILQKMAITVTSDEFNALLAAWGDLTPWQGTQEALETIYNAKFTLGTLSNGDKETLSRAMKVFAPSVTFSYFFSSDFPVGSFKPDVAMYRQLSETTGLTAEQILHVAGANIDGWGSRDAGLYSALLRSPPYPKLPLPCFLLDDISELPAVLGL